MRPLKHLRIEHGADARFHRQGVLADHQKLPDSPVGEALG